MHALTGRAVRRRWGAALLALGLLAAACSSSNDDATSATGPTQDEGTAGEPGRDVGPVPGLTAEAIRVAVLLPDLAALAEAGLAPDFGDFTQNLQVFADEINDASGAAGRRIEMSFHLFPGGASPTDQQAACLGAVQDDDAFLVISTGGTADETVLCVTEQNERLALVMAGAYVPSIYERSEGRLFTNGLSVRRLMRNLVEMLEDEGHLEGASLGIVRPDAPRDAEAAEELRAALEQAGYAVAEEVTLPCADNRCEQADIGVRRLVTGGADAVFSLLGPVTYPAFIGEAEAQGYDPQWFSSDYENQVTATTARFMEGVAEAYDGAVGITSTLDTFEPGDPFFDCNERFTAATGVTHEFPSDAWQAVGNACEMIGRIARVLEAIDADGAPLDQASFIDHMEREQVVIGDRRGSFGPDKHDAYDVLELRRFSSDCVCWESIEGTRRVDDG